MRRKARASSKTCSKSTVVDLSLKSREALERLDLIPRRQRGHKADQVEERS
jgi:hypothetical protein